MTTLAIVNAIIGVGNGIISAVSGGSSSGKSDSITKALDNLRDLLLPEDMDEKATRDQKIIDKLTAAAAKGPIKVRPKATTSRDKGRIKRKSSE